MGRNGRVKPKPPRRKGHAPPVARNRTRYQSPVRKVADDEKPLKLRRLTADHFNSVLCRQARSREGAWRVEGCPLARARAVLWLCDEAWTVEDGGRQKGRKPDPRQVGAVLPRQYAQFRRRLGILDGRDDWLTGRARGTAIGRLIDLVLDASERNIYSLDQGKRRRKTTDGQRRKRREWHDRSPEAEVLVEQKAAVTKAFKRTPKTDGSLRGLYYGLGEFLAPRVCEAYGLGEDHHQAMAFYLAHRASHFTTENIDMPRYHQWRADSVKATREAA